MFRQVYFHRTLRSAESVLHSILRRALVLFGDGKEVWHQPGSAFEKVLRGEKLNPRRAFDTRRFGRHVSHHSSGKNAE
jgi:HD superfamily phosphohydrolase